jgi:hypothetical protein
LTYRRGKRSRKGSKRFLGNFEGLRRTEVTAPYEQMGDRESCIRVGASESAQPLPLGSCSTTSESWGGEYTIENPERVASMSIGEVCKDDGICFCGVGQSPFWPPDALVFSGSGFNSICSGPSSASAAF